MTSARARWPLPSTPATAHDLPVTHAQRDVVDAVLASEPLGRTRRRVPASCAPGDCRWRVTPSTSLRSSATSDTALAASPNMMVTMRSLQLGRRGTGHLVLAPGLPTTRPCLRMVMRSPMAIASWSLWVMKMMARPLALTATSTCLQVGDALGREHRGGLVQDEHPGALPERLDDLDVLLLAERQRTGPHVRVDRHAQGGGDGRAGARARPPRQARCPRWSPASCSRGCSGWG